LRLKSHFSATLQFKIILNLTSSISTLKIGVMRISIISLLILLLAEKTMSQSSSTTMGARSASLGNASTTLKDEWSLFNNIGGLAKVNEPSTAFSFEAKPALPGSSRMAASFSSPLKIGAVGIGVFKFGDKLYSEQILTTGYSNHFGIASLGLKLDYIQYRAEGMGTKSAVSFSLGGIADISNRLSIGANIQNLNQPKLTNDERVPVRLAAGLSFKPSEQILLLTEIEKDLAYDPTLKIGMEYVIHKKVFTRTGFNLNPEAAFFGVGFKGWRLKFDYSIQYTNNLNFAHQASGTYRIKKSVKEENRNNE